jgi:hypothetical protein
MVLKNFSSNAMPQLPSSVHCSDHLCRALWTLEKFQWAATLVASRAFYVDSFHGMSMVPLADLFNHKVQQLALPVSM